MKKFFTLSFIPTSADTALLLLRLGFGLPMLLLHGGPKLLKYSSMMEKFPDPLGIGSTYSYLGCVIGEALCSLLVVLGLATRWAALVWAFTMGVAFFLVHEGALSGEGSGEQALLYLLPALALLIAGAGRFSMDRKLMGGAKSQSQAKPKPKA